MDGVENYLSVLDAWQIEILCEIIDQLRDADMVPAPEWYLVDLEAQDRPCHAGNEEPVVLELLRRSFGKPLLSLDASGLPTIRERLV